jgi:hypothetical protein
MAGSYSEAVVIAREVVNKHPDVTWCYRMMAAWAAMSGDLTTARWAAGKLLQIEPHFTIERYLSRPVFQGVPEWADRTAEGLRQAGLPER